MSCDPSNRVPRPASAWRPIVASRWGQLDILRWSIAALVIGLAVWGLTDVRRRGRLDPQHPEFHRTDFTVYTIAGQTMLYGGDPYTVSNLRGWKYIYPPLFALLVAPLADLDPEIQVTVWFAISVLLGWGCLRECVRIASVALPGEPMRGPFGPIPTWVGAAAVTAAAVPALNCLQRGQIGIAVLYFLLLGFRLLVQSQNTSGAFLAGVALALPIVFKATPLLPVAVALAQQALAAWFSPGRISRLLRPSANLAGAAFGLLLFLLFIPAWVIGWQSNLRHLDTWWNTVAKQEESCAERGLRRRQHYRTQPKPDERRPSLRQLGGRPTGTAFWRVAGIATSSRSRATDGFADRSTLAERRSGQRRLHASGSRLSHSSRARSA